MAESTSNMFVSGSSTEAYSEFIDSNEQSYMFSHQAHSSKSLNENVMDTSVITNDDESTMSIGEIGVDEYFDDIFNNDVFEDTTADNSMQVELSSDVNNDCNGFNNVFNNSLKLPPHTSIVNSRIVKNIPNTSNFIYTQRAAAIKAVDSMAKCCNKRKRQIDENDENKEKCLLVDTSNSTNNIKSSALKSCGINVPNRFYQIYIEDNHHLLDENFISIIPAKRTVYDILCDFARKKSVELNVLNLVLETFDQALPWWCLYRIENLQYIETKKKYPSRRLCQMYGLPHLVRFISCFPKLFNKVGRMEFTEMFTVFTNGFLVYMVEENLHLDLNKEYDNVMPEYHRMTYWPLRINQLRNS